MAFKTGQKKDGRGTWWSDERDGHGWSSGSKDKEGYHYHEHHVDKKGKETVEGWDYDPPAKDTK